MRPVVVGDVLLGYCGGSFGRDSYDDKRVEAIGADWCVAREAVTQAPVFCRVHDAPTALIEYRE